MLQRPSEMTSIIKKQKPPAPQSMEKTIRESPGVLDDTITLAEEQKGNTGLVLTGLGLGGLLALII